MIVDTELSNNEVHLIIFAALTLLLYIRMFIRTVSMVFILNFGGGGLNPTVLFFFATLSGFLYILIGALYFPHTLRFYRVSFAIGYGSLLLTFLNNPILSLAFAVFYQVAITPALISAIIILRKKFAVAATIGILFNIFALALTDFVSFYTSVLGLILLITFSSIWLVYGVFLTRLNILKEFDQTEISSTSAMIGFIGVQAVILAYPNVVATWFNSNLFLIVLIELVAISASLYILLFQGRMIEYQEQLTIFIYVLSFALVVYIEISLIYYLAVLLAQITAFLLLAIGIRERATDSVKVLGAKMGGIQFVILILIFLQVAAPFWTGLPAVLHPILRDNTKLLTLLIGYILPLSAVMALYWRD